MLNLDDEIGHMTRFTWRGKEYSVPSRDDRSLDETAKISKIQKKLTKAQEDGDALSSLEIMKEQIAAIVVGMTPEDVGQLSHHQIAALFELLNKEVIQPASPTEAEIKPEAISADN